MKIINKLKEKNDFTTSEIEIANYLLDHLDSLSTLTIHNLSVSTYSSNATIIRFCQKLGYKGFRDFRVELAGEIESNRYLVNETDYTKPFQLKESTDVIVGNMYSLYKNSLDQVQSQIDYIALEKFTFELLKAKRIFLYGYGDVMLTLKSFGNMLIKIGLFPIIATENGEEFAITQQVTKEDIVLFTTYSGKTLIFKLCQDLLNKKGISYLIITANQSCELSKKSKYHIFVPDVENPDKIATFYSQLAFEYILSLLYALLYRNIKEREQKVQK